jgi:hypothetical protein
MLMVQIAQLLCGATPHAHSRLMLLRVACINAKKQDHTTQVTAEDGDG